MKAHQRICLIRVLLIAFPFLDTPLDMSGQTGILQNDRERNTQAITDLSFQRTYTNFSALDIEGNLLFADMDNDDDLDIIYGGNIYDNSNGYYSLSVSDPGDESYSIVADLNNDNDIDLVTFYRDEGYPDVRYNIRYSPASSTDSQDLLSYFAIINGSSAAGDYNNDGLLDLIFVIYPGMPLGPSSPNTSVFRNESSGNTFTAVDINIYDNAYGSCDWGDFDNDFDNDLLLTGINDIRNKETNVLVNDDAYYNIQDYNLVKISNGQGIWSDYDSDGDLDIILAGENLNFISRIYRNDGESGFQPLSLHPAGLVDCSIASGDLDNDGDVDIIMAGTDQGNNSRVHAYINEGNDVFQVQENIVNVDDVSSIDLGDFDKDGDLDLLTAYDLFRNTNNRPNSPPSVPIGLSSQTRGTDVRFQWQPSTDDMTPSTGLSYNLRVGTTPGGNDIVCPPSYSGKPRLKIPSRGNVSHNTGWQLKDLPPGTYFWSVQAIDAAYACSDFASEGSFTTVNSYFTFNSETIESAEPYYCFSTEAGDYDLDGDYDLIFSHNYRYNSTDGNKTYIMENTYASSPSNFAIVSDRIPGMVNSSFRFCDLDYDDDLDLIVSGRLNAETLTAEIYRNNYPAKTFQAIGAGIPGLEEGSIDFGDYDNDGDYDLQLTGRNLAGTCITHIYRNEDMSFIESDKGLIQLAEGSGVWLDLNNDGYLDIVLSGIGNDDLAHCKIYFGDGNSFVPYSGSLKQLSGQIDYADIDNDGYLEFAIVGVDPVANKYTYIYDDFRQEFNVIPNEVTTCELGRISFGDLDVDGKHDLVLSGGSGLYKSDLYSLDDAGNYTHPLSLADYGSSVELFDLDNDNDMDIFLGGYNDFAMQGWCSYFENNYTWGNTRPTIPDNMRSERSGYGIVLEWDPSTDAESLNGGLSYNVKVGTSPGASDVVSPMADASGKRFIHRIGNAQMNHSYILDSMALGKYYWSVQAIDQSYIGSAWSAEQSFTISMLRADFKADTICQGKATSFIDLSVSSDEPIVSWEWDFGDGSYSVQQYPQHTFISSGIHSVRLIIRSSQFADSIFREIYVKPKPIAGFAADVVCQGTSTSLANLTELNGTSALAWSWDFDDGLSSTVEHPGSHGYLNPGEYTVLLKVWSGNGCSDTVSHLIQVGSIPVASLTANGNPEFCEGDSLVLSCPGGPDYIYQWKIGGANQTGADYNQYVAKASGEYSVEVSNPVGNCMDVSNPLTIKVNTAPLSPIIVSDNYEPGGCQGEDPITLRVGSPENNTSYQWMRNGIPIPGASSNIYQEFLPDGDYSVEAIRHGCGTESGVLTIDYGDMPETPKIIAKGPVVWYLVCANDSATSFRWYRNGERIQGADEFIYVAGSQQGRYEVAIAVGSSCYARSEPMYIPLGTGIEEKLWENLKIYPNPTPGVFTLEMDNPLTGDLIIDIFNEPGAKVVNIKFLKETSHFRTEIDLSSQPAGIYLINLVLDRYRTTCSLMME